jgi:hypothetical protein
VVWDLDNTSGKVLYARPHGEALPLLVSAIHEETLYTAAPFFRRVSLEKRGKCSEDEQNIYLCSTSFISIWADSHYSGQIRPLVCSCVKKFMESASLPGECNATLSTANTSGSGITGMQISTSEAPDRPCVADTYEYTTGLPALLEQLGLSVLLSTYQAGKVVSIGSHNGQLQIGFSHFDQAMGLCRTPTGIAVGTRDAIWTLPANREVASRDKTAKRLREHKAIRGARIRIWLASPAASG